MTSPNGISVGDISNYCRDAELTLAHVDETPIIGHEAVSETAILAACYAS